MFNLFKKTSDSYNFMKFHKLCFGLSSIAILISIVSFFINGLNFGVDFTGGLLFDITVNNNKNISLLRNDFLKNKIEDFNIQSYGNNGFIIRISENSILKQTNRQLTSNEEIQAVKSLINKFFDEDVQYNKIDFVGPQVGKELIIKGLIALILSFLAMLIYISIRFEWKFGFGAVAALIHDTILTFGIYSIFNINFDLTSIAAILTVIGYSVNDKVVIYDRIREFLLKYKHDTLTEIINKSLTTTLRRTLLTSSTTLASLLILAFMGGETLKYFSLVVIYGIVVGTYSSIFISTPLLLYIKQNKK